MEIRLALFMAALIQLKVGNKKIITSFRFSVLPAAAMTRMPNGCSNHCSLDLALRFHRRESTISLSFVSIIKDSFKYDRKLSILLINSQTKNMSNKNERKAICLFAEKLFFFFLLIFNNIGATGCNIRHFTNEARSPLMNRTAAFFYIFRFQCCSDGSYFQARSDCFQRHARGMFIDGLFRQIWDVNKSSAHMRGIAL